MMRFKHVLAAVVLAVLATACGSPNNTVRVIRGGVVLETNAQDVLCEASGPTGSGLAGYDGALLAPLTCTIRFRTDGIFADILQILVTDVRGVYDMRGQPIPIGSGVYAALTLQGQDQAILSGLIQFSEITNIAGGQVSAKYEIQTPMDVVRGSFSDRVQTGY